MLGLGLSNIVLCFFFFQAEDGIRVTSVTGVQTCALPICSRLPWLLSSPVDAVIVELGANDGLRGLDPAQTRDNLDSIMAALKKRQIPTLITVMLAPPNLGEDYGAEFNAIYPDLAKKYGALYDAFYLEGVAADPALNQVDGIHPNADGVAVIVKRLAPKVQELLQQTK